MASEVERAAYWLLKDVNRAVREYAMIQPGDRVAVAVSGGKDSLSLLRLLDLRRAAAQERYELIAIHVLGDGRGPETPDYPPLRQWLEGQGCESVFVPVYQAEGEKLPMNCQRCTWNRRRTLFETAHRLGCNVVAYGHHADDLAQTTLMNILFHGRVETMQPYREYFDGALRLVRPLCYLDEKDLRRFARLCSFPPPPPLCPQSDHSRRQFAAGLVRQAEQGCQDARINLLRLGLRSKAE